MESGINTKIASCTFVDIRTYDGHFVNDRTNFEDPVLLTLLLIMVNSDFLQCMHNVASVSGTQTGESSTSGRCFPSVKSQQKHAQ